MKGILTGEQSSSYSSQRHKSFLPAEAVHQAEFHPLSCQPAAEGEQHWNCQAVSPGAQLEALKGGLCSARPR